MAGNKGKRKRSAITTAAVELEQVAETSEAGSQRSPTPEAAPAVKRSRRRAETRDCPICNEPIPLRLLGKHAELETSRVAEIISHIGSEEPFLDLSYESYASTSALTHPSALESTPGPGSSSSGRRSAVRARKSILEKLAPVRSQSTVVSKAIQGIKRNRKNRHAKLRDMTKEDDEGFGSSSLRQQRITSARGEIVCPVCLTTVRGDEDVQDAHVEACVANESRRLEEERLRREAQLREEEEAAGVVDVDGDDGAGYFGDVRGTGFHRRNHTDQDVDDVIDIDGDDAEIFGSAQFNEGDILDAEASATHTASARTQPTLGHGRADDFEFEGDQPAKILRDLIAESKTKQQIATPALQSDVVPEMDKVNVAIVLAKKKGDANGLVNALENKIRLLENPSSSSSSSGASLCRICLDPYSEPTVSTGCWHTCCRECWLRCLGSTKLCPICKRITAAMELRRVYI
ncbi:hypothetical protein GYMLUDRAFT_36418 [Collybiopsis luxurians FD-317 M1]|nr:hypothetical protein GYMLUDRAFT_36418 [Collybiopsis luxurians FD-317 M1]